MLSKTYSTVNNMGDVGVISVSYARALQDFEYHNDLHPEEEWEVICDDEWEDLFKDYDNFWI